MTATSSPAGGVSPMAELTHILFRVDRLTSADWYEHSAGVEELIYTIEQISRRLAYVESEVVAVVDTNSTWALDGTRSMNTWLRTRTSSTGAAASRKVKLARAVRQDLPATGEALAEGEISVDHAQVLAREGTKTQRLREQLRDPKMGEDFLVGIAKSLDADEFGKAVKHWAGMADPEAADRNWREATDKEELFLSPTLEGYHVSGWLTPASGQAVEKALDAQMGKKAEDDDRSPAQRRAAALVSWAHSWLDSGHLKPGSRIRPHLSVHVPFETLAALCEASGSAIPPGSSFTPGASAFQTLRAPGGPLAPSDADESSSGEELDDAHWAKAWKTGDDHVISTAIDYERLRGQPPATFDDGTPVSPGLLGRLACGSSLTRVVFGPESTILDVGREKRIFPANQTRAIIARDRHCQYPSCTEPPEFGEIHHALWWWKHNGKTSTDQGILLCWWHHSHVHESRIMIARRGGAWVFSTEQGKIITPANSPPRATVAPDQELPFSGRRGGIEREDAPDLPMPPSMWDARDPWAKESE